MIGTPELILIVLALVLLFGAKKIPELMKGLGQGVKSFKDGMNGKTDDSTEEKEKKKDE
ncbi:twin-arginine translocase TatA/TatE family subunit [uncultured Prevotella sp.]|uniref:twin-arginine translocase TatA/TatE family subunit n=1 Tax=uncultured Prevotella sp. TaxID=159272 RepID=UPI00262D72B8|nr:twin-arginine translocase TatA/TatE family subunit [uncultured Prevotella sp.]